MTTSLTDGVAPDLRSTATVQLFADNQFGARAGFSTNWNMRAAADSLDLAPYLGVRANAGDCIEWFTAQPEDGQYQSFLDLLRSDGKPEVDTPGNHDLTTYNNDARFPYTRTRDGFSERMTRSADEWAALVPGRPRANAVARSAGIAVVSLSPDWWAYRPSVPGYAPPDPISADSIKWLDEQLNDLHGTPTWIMSHAIPPGQFAGNPGGLAEYIRPWPALCAVLDAHPHVLGWLSGHWHIDPARSDGFTRLDVGSRKILSINAPSSQGLRGGWNATQHQYGDGNLGPECAKSMFIGYDGASVRVRWRNHNAGAWFNPFGGNVLTLPAHV